MGCKWLLIDGNNLLCRAHFASKLTDKKGRPVSGTFGVMKMTRNIIKKFRPYKVVIAWDIGRSKERIELYSEYKANRINRDPEMREHIQRQRRDCQRLFDSLPVRQIAVPGVEADDVIGVLCEKLTGPKVVLSNDHDFIQLVRKDVKLWLPKQEKLLSVKTVDDFLGFPVKHYVLWKSMVGDSSDNIKGIKGVGVKRATAIILNGVRGKKKLPINSEEQAILDRNKYLISIGALLTDKQMITIKKQFAQEKRKEVNMKQVQMAFIKMGFKSLFYNYADWSRGFHQLKRNEGGMICQR